jgi:hypothetical protein
MLKIMKKLSISLLAFVLLLGVSFSFAGNSSENPPKTVNLSGKVVDKSSEEALAGALVIIEGTDMETYTDFEGNFSFKGVVPDTYRVKCSLISYDEVEQEINVNNSKEEIEISLQNVVLK